MVTVQPSRKTRSALRRNLTVALAAYREELRSRTVWLPLMGTGQGGLAAEDSQKETLESLDDRRILDTSPHRMLLSLPPKLDVTRKAELRRYAALHLGRPVSGRVEPGSYVPAQSFPRHPERTAAGQVDALQLVFWLALDGKVDPDEPIELKYAEIQDGIAAVCQASAQPPSAGAAMEILSQAYGGASANELWSAWMNTA